MGAVPGDVLSPGLRQSMAATLAMVLAPSAASAIELNPGTEALTLSISPQIQPRFEADFDGLPSLPSDARRAPYCDSFRRRDTYR